VSEFHKTKARTSRCEAYWQTKTLHDLQFRNILLWRPIKKKLLFRCCLFSKCSCSFHCHRKWYPYIWGAQIPQDKSPWRLNFVPLHLIFVGPRQRHCFMSSCWPLEFWSGSYLLGKSVYLCVISWCYSRISCFDLIKMNATENRFTKVVGLKLGIQVFWDLSVGLSVCWCFGRKWYLHLQWSHRPVISPLLN